MKKLLLLHFFMAFWAVAYSQTVYKTYYGDYVYPVDTFRVLNFFINIIYDQCENCDPYEDPAKTPNWIPGPPNTINTNPPAYLANFMDSDLGTELHGTYTKRYASASFNKFIILGDNVVVNIAQSRVTPNNTNGYFGYTKLLDAAVSLINEYGGLTTINGHNSISDYDDIDATMTNRFLTKSQDYHNNRIDFLQVYFRNSTDTTGGISGGGRSYIRMTEYLKFLNGDSCRNELGTVQGALGNTDLSNPQYPTADIHEMGHNIFGQSNSIHMGGGGPLNSGCLTTLESNGGWSFMGGSYSSLVSCSGFDRWRLDWKPSGCNFSIAVQNANSDITRSDGAKTFYMRDFITAGDAIRIKLPYKDVGSLDQYIWLENHRLKPNNGHVDYPAYWEYECKDDGVPGVYAYYQVGKDIRENTNRDTLLPPLTDHLVPIDAEGNWDFIYAPDSSLPCINDGKTKARHQIYNRENPFSGYNDQGVHFFVPDGVNTLNTITHRIECLIKEKGGVTYNKQSNLGDNWDAFTNNSSINISSNPTPFNVITYHHLHNGGAVFKNSNWTDNVKIHLSGLRIDFTEQTGGIMKVDIRWDDYNVTKNVTWTGDIALHESVNLISGKTITFDQNYTPNKHTRDAVTGVFAGPTYFRCLTNSTFVMQPSSNVILQNLSSFILASGSQLEINDGAVFTVKSGCTLQIKNGANFVVKGTGRIEVENGGYLCIEAGASGQLQDPLSVINFRNGSILGVNTDVISDPGTCVEDIAADIREYVSGPGKINLYIQNINYLIDTYETGENIYVGYDVTDPPYGNVLINGAKVTLDANGEIFIKNGFEMDSGSELETK